MSLQINRANVNATTLQESSKVKDEKQVQKDVKPQAKEHCSSKASKALKGMALGLMLAAGVASAGKAATVKAAENQSANNQTAVTQEAETNTAKTDVEMAVDKLMEEEGETVTLHVGNRVRCHGAMTNGTLFENGRNYEVAKISHGGKLKFYNVDYEENDRKVYVLSNSFDLGVNFAGTSIDLKAGSRFEEVDNKRGDYVELAEDGTFNVYNSDGELIGNVGCDTEDSFNTKALCGVAGGVVGVGVYAASEIKKKKSEIE